MSHVCVREMLEKMYLKEELGPHKRREQVLTSTNGKEHKMSGTIVPGEAGSIENYEEMPGIANGTWNEYQEFAMNVQ